MASPLSRRDLLRAGAGALAPLPAAGAGTPPPPASSFGVQSFSYAARLAGDPSLRSPLAFLRFCRERGAGGVQTAIPAGKMGDAEDAEGAAPLRRYLDETGAWLEGSVRLPRDAADLPRFEEDLRAARAAGAEVVRTVMLAGRRYETFAAEAEYRRFRETSAASVLLAAPAAARQRVRVAVENHKDYRADELVALMRRVGSEWVGVNLDTGNNLALLEDPAETIAALAPLAFTVHLKDMAVEECADGFLLSEVPFGQGFLDLPGIIAQIRRHRPGIRFNVEMATRDPLRVPCLTERYWATFPALPGRELARTLALVRARPEGRPLARVSGLAEAERLRREDENARACLRWAARLPRG